jgi:protein SCO1/2
MARPSLIAAWLLFALAGCGRQDGGPGVYDAHGVVEDVNREYGQVVIAHDDIPGLMPAMTMSFDVPDRALLETLAPGQAVDFQLEFTGKAYRVVAATPSAGAPGHAGHEGGATLDAVAPRGDPAPAFRLTDQDDQPLALEDLRGKVVLLDFIYTTCPGPCPILTGLHVDVQRHLDPSLRERIRFVSISLDPRNDTPAALREYARKRGADTTGWSFLTGPAADVEAVLRAYGVGSSRQADGTIAHLVVTFLIDGDGRIVQRYIGLDDHDPKQVRSDLERLAAASLPGPDA